MIIFKQDPVKTIEFQQNGVTIGVLNFSGEKVTFTGDFDKSAEEFVERLDDMYIGRVKMLVKQELEKRGIKNEPI